MTKLWSPITLGRIQLAHRLAMAPMTRSRALPDGSPGEFSPLYYQQRASLGLLISEGTQPSADGQGYMLTPGIFNDAHIAGWKKVADSVHQAGGHLFIQLMHAGRMSHPDNTPHHRQSLAPSAIAPTIPMFTATGMQTMPLPRAMDAKDISTTIDDFRRAAAAAIQAGADGVEIHGANGYLIHQFFSEHANIRSDNYGGSIENRARFGIEVARAVAQEIGAERTGFRISPGVALGGHEEGEQGPDLYRYLTAQLAASGLAYLHIVHKGNDQLLRDIREIWPKALLVNRAGRPLTDIAIDLDAGLADIVTVGAWALANPDFIKRLQFGSPLNEADRATFFGGDSHGYTDYPVLAT